MKRHFPSSRKADTAGGNALMRVEALFLPSREHVIEVKNATRAVPHQRRNTDGENTIHLRATRPR